MLSIVISWFICHIHFINFSLIFLEPLCLTVSFLSVHTLLGITSIRPWCFRNKNARWYMPKLLIAIHKDFTYFWLFLQVFTLTSTCPFSCKIYTYLNLFPRHIFWMICNQLVSVEFPYAGKLYRNLCKSSRICHMLWVY